MRFSPRLPFGSLIHIFSDRLRLTWQGEGWVHYPSVLAEAKAASDPVYLSLILPSPRGDHGLVPNGNIFVFLCLTHDHRQDFLILDGTFPLSNPVT